MLKIHAYVLCAMLGLRKKKEMARDRPFAP